MAIKESLINFIKPNKWKVLLAILLLIICVAIGIKVIDPYMCKCIKPDCSNCLKMPLHLSIITSITLAPFFISSFIVREGNAALKLSPIFFIIYYYIISCAIILMIDKIKSKKKK